MKGLALSVALGLVAAACNQTPVGPDAAADAPATEVIITNDKLQFVEINFVPCANGGAGEAVEVNVKLHVLVGQTFDAAGGQHLKLHFQDAGSRGVGLETGAVYRRVGVTRQTENVAASGFPVAFTFVNVFDFVAPGRGNNFTIHEVFHVTVTRKGVTAEVVKSTIRCK